MDVSDITPIEYETLVLDSSSQPILLKDIAPFTPVIFLALAISVFMLFFSLKLLAYFGSVWKL